MVKIEDETLNPDGNVAESSSCHDDSTHDPYYPPIVSLPEVEVSISSGFFPQKILLY